MSRTPGGLLSRAATVARGAREHLPGPAARLLTPARQLRSRTRRTGSRTVVVDLPDATTVTVARAETETVRRHLGPDDTAAPERVAGRVLVTVGDPAALVRLACSGLLAGSVDRLRVLVRWSPAWLRAGAPGIRPDSSLTDVGIRVRGQGIEISLGWSTPTPVGAALDAVLRVVLRTRTTPRHDGPLPALDRAGWQAGAWTWPDGVVLDERPAPASAGPGPLAPFTDPVDFLDGLDVLDVLDVPTVPTGAGSTLVGAVAFPWRRKLLGDPADYRLIRSAAGHLTITAGRGGRPVAVFDGTRGVERVVTANPLTRYATATIDDDVLGTPGTPSTPSTGDDDTVLQALAAVGVVLVPLGTRGRERLTTLGLPHPSTAGAVRGPEGYAWSAAVSRAAGIAVDPVLRRRLGTTPSAGGPVLPTVTVVIASMRPDTVPAVLADLAMQTWPEFEVVLGTHGWTAAADAAERWSELVGRPVRVLAAEPDTAFGEVLGRLSRIADGDLITKVDDDDVYGPDHLTDLVLALRTSGADLVSKAPRFVHLALTGADPRAGGTGRTVDRSWAASEVLDTTPAGGTLLFARSTVLAAGGWSGSVRHVDIDVTARIRRAGGVTYRSHGLGYTYVRHEGGHTWDVDRALFLEQAGEVYDGLPLALAVGRPAALRRDLPGWAGA